MTCKSPDDHRACDDHNARPAIFSEEFDQAMSKVAGEAIAVHHAEGRDVFIMRDDQIVRLRPDGSIAPLEPDPSTSKTNKE